MAPDRQPAGAPPPPAHSAGAGAHVPAVPVMPAGDPPRSEAPQARGGQQAAPTTEAGTEAAAILLRSEAVPMPGFVGDDAQPARQPSSPSSPSSQSSPSASATVAASPSPTSPPQSTPPSSREPVAPWRAFPTWDDAALALRAASRSYSYSKSSKRPLARAKSRSPSPRTLCHIPHGIFSASSLERLPNEVLLLILSYLDVNDLLSMSRTSHRLRCLCVAPILHIWRRRRIRAVLPPLLASPSRPSLSDLIARSIFLTNTTVVSRKLARSLVSIRLSRRLAARPPAQVLVERCVLPPECAPGIGHVAPALAARARAIEREKLKDGLRRWVGAVWQREVDRRSERIRRFEESVGVGKVWRLRKFWERISRGGG